MSRVFAVETTKYDVSPAKQYGEIVYLFDGEGFRPRIFSDAFQGAILDRLKQLRYNHEEDYILPIGAGAPTIQFIAVVLSYYITAKGLLFDSRSGQYMPRILGIPERAEK